MSPGERKIHLDASGSGPDALKSYGVAEPGYRYRANDSDNDEDADQLREAETLKKATSRLYVFSVCHRQPVTDRRFIKTRIARGTRLVSAMKTLDVSLDVCPNPPLVYARPSIRCRDVPNEVRR